MLIKSTHLDKARLLDFYQVMSLTAGFLAKEPLDELKLTAISCVKTKKEFGVRGRRQRLKSRPHRLKSRRQRACSPFWR